MIVILIFLNSCLSLRTPEKDPLGLDPHAPGAKLDAGKPKVGLMLSGFARALLKVAEVTTYGASSTLQTVGLKSLMVSPDMMTLRLGIF